MQGKALASLASLSGLAAGVSLSAAVIEGTTGLGLLATSADLLPLIVVVLVVLALLHHWLAGSGSAAPLAAEMAKRAADLDAREHRLRLSAEAHHQQLAGLAKRLDETLADLAEERRARNELQGDFDELAAEHNTLVQDVLQARATTLGQGRRPFVTGPDAGATPLLDRLHQQLPRVPSPRRAQDRPGA